MKSTRLCSIFLAALFMIAVFPAHASARGAEPLCEILIQPSFQTDTLYGFVDGSAITYSEGVGYELVGLDGKLLTERTFSLIRPYSSWLYVTLLNGKYGALNSRGKTMVAFIFESLTDFVGGYAVSVNNGVTQIISLAGNVGPPLDYDKIELLPGGLLRYKQGVLWGLATVHGEVVTEPVYQEIGDFSEDRSVVKRYGRYGVIDSAGLDILPPEYTYIEPFEDGVAIARNDDGFGLIDKDGEHLTLFKYASMSRYADIFTAETPDGEYFLIDVKGVEYPMPYKPIRPFFESMWVVYGDGLYGIANTSGKIVLPVVYDVIIPQSEFAFFEKDGELGYIDMEANIINSGQLLPSMSIGNGLFITYDSDNNDSLYGVMDQAGKLTLSMEYSFIQKQSRYSDTADFLLICKGRQRDSRDGLWGIIDCFGKLVLPAEYNKIIPCDPLYEDYKDDNAMSDMTNDNETLYDNGVNLSGLYWVLKDDKWGLIKLTTRADTPTAWAKPHVDRAIAAGIVPAGLSKKYSYPATRAEFCEFAVTLYEKLNGERIPVRVQFIDTDNINVEKMAGLGVVAGKGSSKFYPDDPITREEAAIILSKLTDALAVKNMSEGAEEFSDMALISDWARSAVLKVRSLGIMSGVGDGNFGPKGQYTREQCITTLLKVYDLTIK